MLRLWGLPLTALFVASACVYHVVVAGDSQALGDYQNELRSLRDNTEALYKAHSASRPIDTEAAIGHRQDAAAALARIRTAATTLASCVGDIKFPDLAASQRPLELTANISKAADGTWTAACP